MTLHDRIMALEIEDPQDFFDDGHNHGIHRAATRATEADELMAEMALIASGEIYHIYNGLCPDPLEGFDSRDKLCPACDTLNKYKAYKEQSK